MTIPVKSKISIIFLILFNMIVSIPVQIVKASSSIEKINNAIDLEFFSEIDSSVSIVFNETAYLLYPTFENNEIAFDKLFNTYSKSILEIKNACELSELSEDNFVEYITCSNSIVNSPFLSSSTESFVNILNAFFDIYENKIQNEEIVSIIQENNPYTYDILLLKLPQDQSDLLRKTFSVVESQLSLNLITRNITAGNTYAMTYAVNPNSINHYYTFTNDCTNFASQILEAMGQPQDISGGYNENFGWWHYVYYQWYVYTNYQSISFIRADTFMKYFGVTYTSTSHFDLSYNILSGDFIALDFASDGDWNHVGYVVTRDTYAGNYIDENGVYHLYYNYFVAQHTNNYKEWTSTFTNDWDRQAFGTKYGRMSR